MRILRETDTQPGHPDCAVELADLLDHWAEAGASPATIAVLTRIWTFDGHTSCASLRWLADRLHLTPGGVQWSLEQATRLGLICAENAGPRTKTWRTILPIPPQPVDNCVICAVDRAVEPDGLCAICAVGRADEGPSARPTARSYLPIEIDPAVGDGEGSGEGKGKPLPAPSEFVRLARARRDAQENAGLVDTADVARTA